MKEKYTSVAFVFGFFWCKVMGITFVEFHFVSTLIACSSTNTSGMSKVLTGWQCLPESLRSGTIVESGGKVLSEC